MSLIQKKYIVKKQNILNEMRATNMTLQELRFFSIYLSRINPNNVSTRVVRFPLEDFRAIMELGRLNIQYIQSVTNGLLCKVINVKSASGGYTGFQLFKECRVDEDEDTGWYVEIDAHDKALPLLFDFKERFFSYRLWNALRLKSSNQLRMYEVLKQYEKIGTRVLSIDEVKGLLGIAPKEYKLYSDFKKRVLDSCKKALSEWTDIKFDYEPYGKKGKGGKILALKFIIKKNMQYSDPTSLDKFIADSLNLKAEQDTSTEIQPEDGLGAPASGQARTYSDPDVIFFAEACNNEFTEAEMNRLIDALRRRVTKKSNAYDTIEFERFHVLQTAYLEMCARPKVYSRVNYLLKILEGKSK